MREVKTHPMDKNELKVQALREALRDKVSKITDEYEDRIADLRIEITELTVALDQANARIQNLEGEPELVVEEEQG